MRFVALLFAGLMLAAGLARAEGAGGGWLGVELADLTKAEADALGWEGPRGAKVVKAAPGGPAEAAGVQAGDVLRYARRGGDRKRQGVRRRGRQEGGGGGNPARHPAGGAREAAGGEARRAACGAESGGGCAYPDARHRRAYGADHAVLPSLRTDRQLVSAIGR